MGDPQSPAQRARELISARLILKIGLRALATLFFLCYIGSVSLALLYPHLRSWLPLREHLDILHNLLEEEIWCRLGGGVYAQVIELLAYISACLDASPRVQCHVLHGDIGLLREIH